MFEYIKKNFVDRILYLAAHNAIITFTQYDKAMEMIQELPGEDVVKVTRCKDCIHKHGVPGQPNIICGQMHDDDFCSYGEAGEPQ